MIVTDSLTLLHRLREHARSGPERVAFQQVDRELRVTRELTYAELWERTRAGAAVLRQVAVPGERVLIFFEPGIEPLLAFLATLAAGLVAVPAALPPAVSAALAQRKPSATRRMEATSNLLADAEPRVVLAAAEARDKVAALLADGAHAIPVLAQEDVTRNIEPAPLDESRRLEARAPMPPDLPAPENLAFLQYTSGSTALPKGVAVTHANLVHNLTAIGPFVRSHRESVFISWLPMFHDMGLVGDALHPLWAGCRCVKLLPADFLRRPRLWMAAAAKFGGTITGGPNFAYALAAQQAENNAAPLDLSRLEVCYCGSEPIRAATMEAFAAAHAPHGLRRGALFPCYGMAESTLLVSGVKGDAPFAVGSQASGLTRHAGVSPAVDGSDSPEGCLPGQAGTPVFRNDRTANDRAAEPVVSCGFVAEAEVTILDPETGAVLPDGTVGEIVVRSRSISPGYWRDLKTEAARTFPDEPRTLRTGDLGFLRDAQLYVSGRIKNTLIVRGRKLVAEDVESLIERELAAVERVRAAVFPVATARGEEVVVLIEGAFADDEKANAEATARAALGEACGFVPAHVGLVRPGSLPRTTSGKLQRQLAAALWAAQQSPSTV